MKKNYQKLFSYLFTAAHLQLLVCATGNSCQPHGNGNTLCTCTNHTTTVDPLDTALLCTQPKYYIPTTFPKFTVHPISTTRDPMSHTQVTLTCNISSVRDFNNNPIIWEHNGAPIVTSDDRYEIHEDSGYSWSSLTFVRPELVESEGTYRCKVDYRHGNFSLVSREASYSTARHNDTILVLPQNQTVLTGTMLSLSCILGSSASPSSTANITWFLNNSTLSDETTNTTHYLITGEVLVIRNVSMEMEGWYTCVTASGESHSAYIDVIDGVTIHSSSHDIVDGRLSLSTRWSANYTLSLSCDPISELSPWNIGGNLRLEWFFRGTPLNVSSTQDSHSPTVDFSRHGNILTMTSDDPWELIGSVQCFVSIFNFPTAESPPTSILSADVHVIAKGKPNPPISIVTNQRVNYFTHTFHVTAKDSSSTTCKGTDFALSYETVALNEETGDYSVCTYRNDLYTDCVGVLLLDTVDFIVEHKRTLYVRVAIEVDHTFLSDYLPFRRLVQTGESLQDLCAIPLLIDRAPPQPQFNGSNIVLPSDANLWSVTQEWNVKQKCQYPDSLYKTNVTLTCPNQVRQEQVTTPEYTFNTTCNTVCDLTVTLVANGSETYQSHSSTKISTGPIASSVPPSLNFAERINDTTFDVNVILPDKNISCTPPFLSVSYSSSPEGNSSDIIVDINDCNTTSFSSPSCLVSVDDSCGEEYYLQVAYGNFVANESYYSNYSETIILDGASQADVLDGFISLVNTSISKSEITIDLTFNDNITCFVEKGLIISQICFANLSAEGDCQQMDYTNCLFAPVDGTSMKYSNLSSNTAYCFMANLSYLNGHRVLSSSFLTQGENVRSSSTEVIYKPNAAIDWKTIVIITASLLGVSIIIIFSLFILSCRYYRKKQKQSRYHRLLNRDNESIHNGDLVSIEGQTADRAESIISDRTEVDPLTPYTIQRFLNDESIPEEREEEEDRPSIHDDFSHQGEEGMEEELEREGSLVGSCSSEAGVVENGSTGSLEKRQNMKNVLSQIQRNNCNHTKKEESVELISLTPPKVVASPESLPAIPNTISSPLVNTLPSHHRNYQTLPVHNGYTPKEGLHNILLLAPTSSPHSSAPRINSWAKMNHEPNPNGRVIVSNRGCLPQQPPASMKPQTASDRSSGVTLTRKAGEQSQTTAFNRDEIKPVASEVSSKNGYVLSSAFEGQDTHGSHMTQQPLGADSLMDLPFTDMSGYVAEMNSQPLLNRHVTSNDGYIHDSLSSSRNNAGYIRDSLSTGTSERECRGKSAESGNDEESTSNEGDSNSVFDDDVVHSGSSAREDCTVRPRSTATSGFVSGSSESASPEPPNKLSPSPPPSPPASVPLEDEDLPPLLDNLSHPFADPPSDSPPLHLSSFAPPSSHSQSGGLTGHSSYTSQKPSVVSGYCSSSTGSSGYVTNSSQSYHSSSATSQTSKSTSDDLLEADEPSSKYTVPSLLCSSNSSLQAPSPASQPEFTNHVLPNHTSLHSVHYSPHPVHKNIQVTPIVCNPNTTGYINTKDVDLNTIVTTFDEPSSDRTSDHQDVSFDFPIGLM